MELWKKLNKPMHGPKVQHQYGRPELASIWFLSCLSKIGLQRELEAIPAVIGQKAEYTLDRSQVQLKPKTKRETDNLTLSNLHLGSI